MNKSLFVGVVVGVISGFVSYYLANSHLVWANLSLGKELNSKISQLHIWSRGWTPRGWYNGAATAVEEMSIFVERYAPQEKLAEARTIIDKMRGGL